MTRPTLTDEPAVKAWNDRMAAKYDLELFHRHPSPLVRYIEAARVRRTFTLLEPRPGDRVLEVGCGAGHLLARLPAGRGFGLDLCEPLLRKAERRLGRPGVLVQANAERLPFCERAWDRVYCSEVLEHVAHPEAVLAELARVVAPDGVVVVSVPNERLINRLKGTARALGLYRIIMRATAADYTMPERMDDEWHLHAFERRRLLGVIPAGLTVTRVEAVPFAWLPMHYVIQCRAAQAAGSGR